MSDSPECPRCGTRMAADVANGICPVCELRGALDESGDAPLISGLEPLEPDQPTSIGDYVLLEEVGRGGMGIVYRARQTSLNRIVALKLLPFGTLSNPAFVKRFRAEASAAAGLHHPGIVTVYEVGVNRGQQYLAMNYVQGPTLSRLVDHRPLPVRRAAKYLQAVAEAVHHAHQHGILHRDIKPSNVLVNQEDQPLVTDFGLARRLDGESSLTLPGHVLGSPSYMPPEQAASDRGRVGRHTDVYGLGATLYHLITGRPPFQAATIQEAIRQVLDTEPVSPRLLNPDVPRDLETICLKCLEKKPERRYATAMEVSQELHRFLSNQPVLARPVGRAGRAWRWCQRRPALAGLGLGLMVTFVLGLAGVFWQWRQAEANAWLATRNAYASDMKQVQQSAASGDRGTALALLSKYVPARAAAAWHGWGDRPDPRGWEWRYLRESCRSDELSTLHRYPSWVGGLAVSRSRNLLAVRTGEDRIALWNLAEQRVVTNLSAASQYWGGVAISADGNLLAAGHAEPGEAAHVDVWDLRHLGSEIRLPHPSPVRSIALSPHGQFLATRDIQAVVKVWEVEPHRIVAEFESGRELPGSSSNVLQFSPDGRLLAFQDRFSSIRVVDWQQKADVLVIEPDPGSEILKTQVTTLAFSPSGGLLAWATVADTIHLWDVVRDQDAGELVGHDDWILSLAFTPDGGRLASASGDQTIRVWDLAERRVERCLRGHEYEVWAVAFLPDGKTLVSGGKDGTIRLWDIDRSAPPPPHSQLPTRLGAFDYTLGQGVLAIDRNGVIGVHDPSMMEPVEALAVFGTNIHCLAMSPRADFLATATPAADGSTIRVWNWRTRQTEKTLHAAWIVNRAWFSTSGTFLCVGRKAWDDQQVSTLAMWRTGPWERVPWPADAVRHGTAADISRDDRLLAVGYVSGEIMLWSIPERRLVAKLPGHPSRVDDLHFSPDGERLASAGWDDFVKIWNVRDGREVATLRSHFTHTISVAFSPDGQRLAVGGIGGNAGDSGSAVELWDPGTERALLLLSGGCTEVAFSADGSQLGATSHDGSEIHIWRAPSRDVIDASPRTAHRP